MVSGRATGKRNCRYGSVVATRKGKTMDGRTFDRWTRSLGGTNRREAMRLLIAGLTTGTLAVVGARGATAQVAADACGKKGDRCRNNGDCCDRFRCKNDKCRDKKNNGNNGNCGKDGDRCKNNGDCCNKLKCKNDRCRNQDNNDACGRQGDRCKNNGDCCNNFRCKNDKCREKN